VATFLETVGRICAVLGAFGLAVPTALAQLTFSAPPECGSQQEFLAEVRALQRADAPPLRVTSVSIREAAQGVYELRLDGADGERVLTDAECRTLFRSAVVIAAAAAGDAVSEQATPAPPLPPPATQASPASEAPPPAPAPAAPAPAAPAPPPAAAAAPAPAFASEASEPSQASAPSDSYLRIAAGGGLATGLSPDPALLLEFGAAYGSEAWGGALVLKYLPKSSATTEGDAGLELQTIGGRSGIFYAPLSFLRVEGGLAVYRLSATGTGIRYPTTDSVWMAAPELEVMFVAQLNRSWALEVGPQGRVGLTQPTFQVDPQTEVFQLPRFGAALVFRVQLGLR